MKIARKRSGIASKLMIFVVIVAVAAVVFTVVFTNLFENKFFAEKKFEELSRNYYENSLYENFIMEHNGENLDDVTDALAAADRAERLAQAV